MFLWLCDTFLYSMSIFFNLCALYFCAFFEDIFHTKLNATYRCKVLPFRHVDYQHHDSLDWIWFTSVYISQIPITLCSLVSLSERQGISRSPVFVELLSYQQPTDDQCYRESAFITSQHQGSSCGFPQPLSIYHQSS
jgi:hypothetical protein